MAEELWWESTVQIMNINLEGSGLPTVDPNSLSLLGYVQFCKMIINRFLKVKLEPVNCDHNTWPSISVGGSNFLTIEDLRQTRYNIENLRGIPPVHDVVAIERHIKDIESACIWGLKLLQPEQRIWQMRAKDCCLDKEPEVEKMRTACKYLSDALDDKGHLLTNWYTKCHCPSYLDCKLFGVAVIIDNCFGSTGNSYHAEVRVALREHLNLQAYLERLYYQLILNLEYSPRNYDSLVRESGDLFTDLTRKENLITRSSTSIYQYSSNDGSNPLGLPEGEYVLKVSSIFKLNLEADVEMHKALLHKCFLGLEGYGKVNSGNDILMFLVYRRMKKGDLHALIPALEWSTTFKLLRQIAYALHIAHTSNKVLCDLKPANILVDDDGSALLCDFGSAQEAFLPFDGKGLTGAYCDQHASPNYEVCPSFDIYSYGATLFHILSNSTIINEQLVPKILEKLIAGQSIITERLRDSGCNIQREGKITQLGLDCVGPPRERPSALGIVRRLDAMQMDG